MTTCSARTARSFVGFRTYGHSKDHRPDLPQIVIGMAVTRTGIPIRVWCWPGNTNDSALIRQVKDDLRAWRLGRVVWVADRGFTSAENRRYLQRAGGHYIVGEKLRGTAKRPTPPSPAKAVTTPSPATCGQRGRRRRRRHARPLRDLPQPRPSATRPSRPRNAHRPARRRDRRIRRHCPPPRAPSSPATS